jgi:hypothetical protein
MTTSRWLPALAALLSVAAPAEAQFVPSYGGPPGYYGYGGGFRYSRVRGRSSLSIGVGFYRGGYVAPPIYGGGYGYGVTTTRVTIVTYGQPLPYSPGSLLDQLPPDLLPRQRQLDEQLPVPDLPPMQPVPQVPKDDKDKEKEKKEKEKKEKEKKEEKKKEPPKQKPPEPPDEFTRLMQLGLELFAQQQYGRAAARFRQAAILEPKQPLPSFLLAQALLEQGKYDDARDAILDGLKRGPDWPAARFRPHEFYGANQEDYAELLANLERIQTRTPNDPVLLLLRGHALWFDGQKDQAAVLFRRARNGPDAAAVERFLAALPDEDL